jgi:hypothetical protein
MRRAIAAAVLGFGAWAACGCMASATPDEIQKMCENFARLNGADQIPTKEALVADVDQMFDQLQKDIKATRDVEAGLWDKELQAKLAAAKDDAEKASLQTLYDAKKKQVEEKMQLDLAALSPSRAEKLAGVDEKIKTAKAELAAEIKKCTDKANAEKVSQELAKCRAESPTLDKYNQVCY